MEDESPFHYVISILQYHIICYDRTFVSLNTSFRLTADKTGSYVTNTGRFFNMNLNIPYR